MKTYEIQYHGDLDVITDPRERGDLHWWLRKAEVHGCPKKVAKPLKRWFSEHGE